MASVSPSRRPIVLAGGGGAECGRRVEGGCPEGGLAQQQVRCWWAEERFKRALVRENVGLYQKTERQREATQREELNTK